MGWNGTERNGMECNGTEWNAMTHIHAVAVQPVDGAALSTVAPPVMPPLPSAATPSDSSAPVPSANSRCVSPPARQFPSETAVTRQL